MKIIEDLPPIPEKKNPVIAGILGFLFGGIELGLYFQTWKDFLYPVIVFVMLSILLAPLVVVGPFFALVFAAVWGNPGGELLCSPG
jgi:hypothetical protein